MIIKWHKRRGGKEVVLGSVVETYRFVAVSITMRWLGVCAWKTSYVGYAPVSFSVIELGWAAITYGIEYSLEKARRKNE